MRTCSWRLTASSSWKTIMVLFFIIKDIWAWGHLIWQEGKVKKLFEKVDIEGPKYRSFLRKKNEWRVLVWKHAPHLDRHLPDERVLLFAWFEYIQRSFPQWLVNMPHLFVPPSDRRCRAFPAPEINQHLMRELLWNVTITGMWCIATHRVVLRKGFVRKVYANHLRWLTRPRYSLSVAELLSDKNILISQHSANPNHYFMYTWLTNLRLSGGSDSCGCLCSNYLLWAFNCQWRKSKFQRWVSSRWRFVWALGWSFVWRRGWLAGW